MTKINSIILALCCGITLSAVNADDIGNFPGYVSSPAQTGSKTVVKTQYGECVKNQYWKPEYGQETCGDGPNQAPKAVYTKVEFSESSTQLFAFNSAKLTDGGVQELTGLVNKYGKLAEQNNYTLVSINVVGHTDMIGSKDYNKQLSAERASAVKDFLVSQGIDGGIISSEGVGPTDAEASPACLSKYGPDDMGTIERLTAKLKKASPAQKQEIHAELAKFEKEHSELVACMASDRRVDIFVEANREETAK